MAFNQLRNVNFGRNRANMTGSTGVGYTLMDVSGSIVAPRITAGVYQLASGSGLYAAYISFPDSFHGQVMWDCPPVTSSYGYVLSQSFATEQFNYEENNPLVDDIDTKVTQMSGTLAQLYDISFGRWHIVGNQMVFYKEDNITEVARFNLLDDTNTPSMDAVFQRVKI